MGGMGMGAWVIGKKEGEGRRKRKLNYHITNI
jgi:hypothetical protein